MPQTSLTAVVFTLLATSALAADRNNPNTHLSVDLGKGVIVDTTRKTESPLLDENKYTIRRDESTSIEIAQQNPLLFVYESKVEAVDTDEFKAALEFQKQLKLLLALFPAPQGSLAKTTIGGLDLESFRKDLGDIADFIDQLPGDLAASVGTPAQIELLKKKYAEKDVAAIGARLDRAYAVIATIATSCMSGKALKTDSGETVICDGPAALGNNVSLVNAEAQVDAQKKAAARLAEATAQAASQLAAAETQLKKAAAKDKPALQAKVKALTAQHEAAIKTEKDAAGQADSAASTTVAMLRGPSGRPTLQEFVTLALSLETRVRANVAILRDVSTDVAVLGTPFALVTLPYSLQRQTVTVDIKAASKYDAFIDAATRKKRAGALKKFTIVLEPYQPAHLSLAPAFVLGFVRNPTFTAVKKGDTFVIQQDQSELTRYTIAVMLNITPDSWQEPTFGGHFQIGLTPIKDQMGFYLGAGIRAQKLFSFGGGVMVQQVRQLAGALTLDSKLTDPSELKTETRFKTGAYIHATVELK